MSLWCVHILAICRHLKRLTLSTLYTLHIYTVCLWCIRVFLPVDTCHLPLLTLDNLRPCHCTYMFRLPHLLYVLYRRFSVCACALHMDRSSKRSGRKSGNHLFRAGPTLSSCWLTKSRSVHKLSSFFMGLWRTRK